MLKHQLDGLKHGLGSFSNAELYFIITELFNLGGLEDSTIEAERLYVRPAFEKDNKTLQFVYVKKLKFDLETVNEKSSSISFGFINNCFSKVGIGSSDFGSIYFNINSTQVNYNEVFEYPDAVTYKHSILKPISLADSLSKIINQLGFNDRKINPLFLQNHNCPTSNTISVIGFNGKGKDTSETYFKISNEVSDTTSRFAAILNYQANKQRYNEGKVLALDITEQLVEKRTYTKFI